MTTMDEIQNIGTIVQVSGPVVDVQFKANSLPAINNALYVDNNGTRSVMEVAQHIGNNTVRCIMLASSEGLHKDMEVTATGSGIKVPVGKGTLGRLFNVLGDTLDGGESLEGEKHWVIHRDPPSFEDQSPVVEDLRQVSRSSTCLRRMQKVVRSVCSVVPVLVRPY